MMSYVMTVDVGTTSLKAALISKEGMIVQEGGESYPVRSDQPGWAEQDPTQIWDAICRVCRNVVATSQASTEQIEAVVFVAPWKNIIPVSAEGEVLRDSIIWLDGRGTEQAKRLNASAGFFVGTGQEFWPRLMWVKENEPEIWAKADKIMGINTYIKWRATGEWTNEPSDDLIHSQNPALQEHFSKILKAADLDEDLDKFAESRPSTDIIGTLTEEAATQLGLAVGTKVLGGFGDLVAISLGVGRSRLNEAHIYFGSSSWLVSIIKDRFHLDAPLYFTLDDSVEGAVFALQTGCMALDWVLEQTYRAEKQLLGSEIFSIIDEDVTSVEPGSMGLVATHWLNGELPPLSKNAKGIFLNLTSSHDRRHMVRAMMESLCYTHRHNLEIFQSQTGTTLPNVRVVGGGAVSDIWMQILADVLQVTVQVPQSPRYAGTMGAFYCAAVGLGWLENVEAVADAVPIAKEFIPNEDNREVYDKMYSVYLKLHPALHSLFTELNGD